MCLPGIASVFSDEGIKDKGWISHYHSQEIKHTSGIGTHKHGLGLCGSLMRVLYESRQRFFRSYISLEQCFIASTQSSVRLMWARAVHTLLPTYLFELVLGSSHFLKPPAALNCGKPATSLLDKATGMTSDSKNNSPYWG